MRYQAYIIGDKGIEIKIVTAESESEAMNIVFEKNARKSDFKKHKTDLV